MHPRSTRLVIAILFAIGAAVRINNALVFSPVRAYDGFAHFSYVWFMAENWWVPLPTSAWQFFHPPLYYAFMAGVWDALASVDPLLRLRFATMAIAIAGLAHAWAARSIVLRLIPGDRIASTAAAGMMLFLPVHLYTAGFLGNEYLCAVFCTLSLLALLQALDKPTLSRSAWLGLWLGAAMMTKFTGVVVVAGAFGTLFLRAFLRNRWQESIKVGVIAGTVLLLCAGWFYGRNLVVYGNPFQMSRETFVLARYEHIQTRGKRDIWEYILFDPVILRRPQWPRGTPLVQEVPVPYERSALRESVLTGLYANTWFDGYGGWVLPSVSHDNTVRRAGQALLTLGLVPTLLVVLGFFRAVVRLFRDGWDDTLGALVTTFVAMAAVVVHGTSSVPVHAAVKSTYLLPVTAVFGVWLGLGIDYVARRHRRLLTFTTATCAILAILSVGVFLQGRTVARYWFEDSTLSALWHNVYGVIYYAGGDVPRSRQFLQKSADEEYHLGYENLAVLALGDGEPLKAAYYYRRALQLQPSQSLGTPRDREIFNRNTAAEYLTSTGVAYAQLGWWAAAEEATRSALAADRSLPEAVYNSAVLASRNALEGPSSHHLPARRAWLQRGSHLAFEAVILDQQYREPRRLLASLLAIDGQCDAAASALAGAEEIDGRRLYPIDTGLGDMLAASLKRRRHLTGIPQSLDPNARLADCHEQPSHGS